MIPNFLYTNSMLLLVTRTTRIQRRTFFENKNYFAYFSRNIGSLSMKLEVRIQKFASLFFEWNNISIIQCMLKNNSVALQYTKQKQMPMQNVKDITCQNSYIRNFQLHT